MSDVPWSFATCQNGAGTTVDRLSLREGDDVVDVVVLSDSRGVAVVVSHGGRSLGVPLARGAVVELVRSLERALERSA